MSKTETTAKNRTKKEGFAFGRENYILLVAGIITILIGYFLMAGGGTDNPNEFNAEELFHPRRITVAPIVILLGFVVIVVAIMKKPKAS
jgi:hypothetical protein